MIAAYNLIVDDVRHQRPLVLTSSRVREFNRLVLNELPPTYDDMTPGELRSESVTVGNYRGAPAENCEYLLESLCQWLEELRTDAPEELRQAVALLSTIMAHLYIAWVHPFGDGNGRTARLLEFQLLVQAGIPTIAAHVLSDFYNRTRTRYYRNLGKTSRKPYPVENFLKYALQGFVDELREQIRQIRGHQLVVMWQNYVHERFREINTPARVRQRHLVLALPSERSTAVSKIHELTPRLAVEYSGLTHKAVTRDLNSLETWG